MAVVVVHALISLAKKKKLKKSMVYVYRSLCIYPIVNCKIKINCFN